MSGGVGSNTLWGGEGRDTFVFEAPPEAAPSQQEGSAARTATPGSGAYRIVNAPPDDVGTSKRPSPR